MQFINQAYLILLASILLGILSSTVYKVRVGGIQGEQRPWPISIL